MQPEKFEERLFKCVVELIDLFGEEKIKEWVNFGCDYDIYVEIEQDQKSVA